MTQFVKKNSQKPIYDMNVRFLEESMDKKVIKGSFLLIFMLYFVITY